MVIQFNQISGVERVPLWYAEINPAQSPFQSQARLLLVGQVLSTATVTAGEPVQVSQDADGLFGIGSMLADMYRIARLNAPLQEIWALPLADDGAGVKATGDITVSNMPPTQDVTVSVWIGDERVRTIAYTSDTNDLLAARLSAAINAVANVPVVATVAANVISLEAKHAGEAGNDIRLETNYYGQEGPTSGNAFAFTQMSGGTGNPDLATFLPNLGDEEFDWIACPYSDTVNLNAMGTFLNGVGGRWSPTSQLYGHYITARNDTFANLSTFGSGRNDPHTTVMSSYNAQSPSWQWAAAVGAQAASHLQSAPELSRPLQTLDLIGILPPKSVADRPNLQERQVFYYDGISSYHVEKDGTVSIDRLITNYRLNEWGYEDASFLDVNTMAQNMFAIRYLRAKVTGTWGRAALIDENPNGIQGVATPEAIRQTIVHGYQELSNLNVVENVDEFEEQLIVERNAVDANRVDIYLPADQVNQLRIIAVNYVSHLQYSNA
jgi:phage tail sheath gpL-like